MKRPAFPLTIRRGNSSVKIYYSKNGAYDEFKVAFFHEGRRKLETFSDFDRAKARADAINEAVNEGNSETLSLSKGDFQDFQQAHALLQTHGISLANLALQFCEAKKLLGTASVIEAAQFWKSRHREITAKPIPEIVDEYLKFKTSLGVSADMIKYRRCFLKRFGEAFPSGIQSISAAEVDRLLSQPIRKYKTGKKVTVYNSTTYNVYHRAVSDFLKFAIQKDYLASDMNVTKKLPLRRDLPRKIEIYTPKEMASLLLACDMRQNKRAWPIRTNLGPLKAVVALGGFAGLRTQEILRLKWENIGVGSGSKYIEISAAISKTKNRRLVPISKNLMAWLGPVSKTTGPIWPLARASLLDNFEGLGETAGIKWRRNALRHSYISYRVAATSDVAKVSLEAGNTPAIIHEHYREVVTPESADEWFSIMPGEASDKITYLNAATA